LRLLVIEDDAETLQLLQDELVAAGFEVDGGEDLATAAEKLSRNRYDALVIDWMLPDGSGVEFCREQRAAGCDTPLLILTARANVADRVEGLEAGADDYLRKPFAIAELVARVRALTRRGRRSSSSVVTIGPATIDFPRRSVTVDAQEVTLTARERSLLELLLGADGEPLSRSEILAAVWGEETTGAAASLEVIISRLRRKLSTAEHPFPIETHRGFGYSVAR
jgi:two-component system OmpR family response regulator